MCMLNFYSLNNKIVKFPCTNQNGKMSHISKLGNTRDPIQASVNKMLVFER